MSSAYVIESLDLSIARDRQPITSTQGQRVATVYVIDLPAAASIHFGGGQPWKLEQGKTYKPCPGERDGLAISNAVGAGTLVLGLTMEGHSIEVSGSLGALSIPEPTRNSHFWEVPVTALNGAVTYVSATLPVNSVLYNTQGLAATWALVEGRACRIVRPSLVTGQLCLIRPNALDTVIDWRPTFAAGGLGALEASGGIPALCANHAAWLRRVNVADTTSARQCFGFEVDNATPLGATATVARVGLIGDGATGYRFASVNCPDGAAAGVNATTDRDANSVQPLALVNPGAKWFHVRIKVLPPTPEIGARVACYLNSRLAALFTLAANLPRGTGAVNRNGWPMHACILADRDAVIQLDGWNVFDPEFWLDNDYSLS